MNIALTEVLRGKQTAALAGHIRPDGVCIGSSVGLYLYLKENFPQIQTDIYLQPVAELLLLIEYQGTAC